MNRRTAIQSVAIGTAAVATMAPEARAAGKDVDAFSDHWESAKTFTLKVADAMPADAYDFKPKPDMRPFGELMQHLGTANVYYISRFQRVDVPDSLKPPTEFNKETTKQYLNASFDYCSKVFRGLTDEALDKAYPGRPTRPAPQRLGTGFKRFHPHGSSPRICGRLPAREKHRAAGIRGLAHLRYRTCEFLIGPVGS